MNLAELLQVLQEVNKLLATLQAMGLHVDGTLSIDALTSLFKRS